MRRERFRQMNAEDVKSIKQVSGIDLKLSLKIPQTD
jgi:hypothetical protein